MNLDPKAVRLDKSGKYTPKSLRICFVCEGKTVDIDWALNAFTLRTPIHTKFITDVAASPEMALERWIADEITPTSHLLIWPENQLLAWNAIAEAWKEFDLGALHVRIGRAILMRKERGPDKMVERHDLDPRNASDESDVVDTLGKSLDLAGADPAHSVVISIPSLGRVSPVWMSNCFGLTAPIGIVAFLNVVTGYPVPEARELLVSKVMEMNPRPAYLLFLGDDNLPPINGMQLLFDAMTRAPLAGANLGAVSGLYMVKHDPPQAVAWRGQQTLVAGVDYDPAKSELIEVDGSGLDFCLLRTDYIEKIGAPRFANVENIDMQTTEDVYFWHKWRQATQTRPFVLTGCRVGHFDLKTDHIY